MIRCPPKRASLVGGHNYLGRRMNPRINAVVMLCRALQGGLVPFGWYHLAGTEYVYRCIMKIKSSGSRHYDIMMRSVMMSRIVEPLVWKWVSQPMPAWNREILQNNAINKQ